MSNPGVVLGVFGRSDVGLVRKNNEDAFVVADLTEEHPIYATAQPVLLPLGSRGVLLAVADGMGGEQAGEVASALALQALHRELPIGEGGNVETALTASVEKANQSVWQVAADTGRTGMGATLTAVLIHGDRAYVAEVGDSRAYVLRGSRLVQVTRDQSFAQHLLDTGAITDEQAEAFPYKNVIMQAIGTKPSVVVALNRFTLRRNDRFLLCSDGLTGQVKDEEIRGILLSTVELDVACAKLIELANHRGGVDNVTVVLANVTGDSLPESTDEGRISLELLKEFTGKEP